MQKQTSISIYTAVAVLIALTACGSIWDLEIANTCYVGETPSDNIFGVIFSYIGVIPTFVGWSFLGSTIFYLSKKQVEDTKKRRWLIAFSILLLLLSVLYFCNTICFSNANVFEVNFVVAYSIGIAVIAAAAYLGYKLSEQSSNADLLKKALFLAAVSLVTLVIISSAKEIMCRPRYRYVLAMGDLSYFRSWWQNGRSLKESLGDGVISDEFTSMPSGHSAYSMFAIFIFPFLSDYVDKLKKFKPHLFALGFIWWAMTAISRMTMGAHYLTDVTIAGLLAIFAYATVSLAKNVYLDRKRGKR